ncbi:hypothetical protein [Amycolatopsis pittospori]|uniref:hypothetical protein n=1 Tax=Amycolatopsis pittospori TaxID=2749434 RepID=UPI0015F02CE8|nr:hypothetical protein [Amycolatopsis pittospori]
MSKGQKPAQRFWGLVGRVAAFLFGAGMTVLALLTATGEIAVMNGSGEPTTDVTRILVGLVHIVLGLTTMGAAIAGFPEGSHGGSGPTERESGFEDDGDIDID